MSSTSLFTGNTCVKPKTGCNLAIPTSLQNKIALRMQAEWKKRLQRLMDRLRRLRRRDILYRGHEMASARGVDTSL